MGSGAGMHCPSSRGTGPPLSIRPPARSPGISVGLAAPADRIGHAGWGFNEGKIRQQSDVLEEDATLIKDVKETNAKVPPSQRKALEDFIKARYGKRIEAAHTKAAPYRACMTHPKVKKYADRIAQ